MSGGPFRELFVELSEQAFAVARAIGEQAVAEAKKRADDHAFLYKRAYAESRESKLLHAIHHGPGAGFLRGRYNWCEFAIVRSEWRTSFEIWPRLKCGHWTKLDPIDERVLAMAQHGAILDALLDAIDDRVQLGRDCYCVPRERK